MTGKQPQRNDPLRTRKLILDCLRKCWSGEPGDATFEERDLSGERLTALDLAEIVASQITDLELEEGRVLDYLAALSPAEQRLSELVRKVRKLALHYNEAERRDMLGKPRQGNETAVERWPANLNHVTELVTFCRNIERGSASSPRPAEGRKQELALAFIAFLKEDGFVPDTDADGDVRFKFEGGTYLIIIDENDPLYVRLVYPNFWALESEEEKARAIQASQTATARTKSAKVYVVNDNTWASIEAFYPSTDAFRAVLLRSLQALKAGVASFVELMRGEP